MKKKKKCCNVAVTYVSASCAHGGLLPITSEKLFACCFDRFLLVVLLLKTFSWTDLRTTHIRNVREYERRLRRRFGAGGVERITLSAVAASSPAEGQAEKTGSGQHHRRGLRHDDAESVKLRSQLGPSSVSPDGQPEEIVKISGRKGSRTEAHVSGGCLD